MNNIDSGNTLRKKVLINYIISIFLFLLFLYGAVMVTANMWVYFNNHIPADGLTGAILFMVLFFSGACFFWSKRYSNVQVVENPALIIKDDAYYRLVNHFHIYSFLSLIIFLPLIFIMFVSVVGLSISAMGYLGSPEQKYELFKRGLILFSITAPFFVLGLTFTIKTNRIGKKLYTVCGDFNKYGWSKILLYVVSIIFTPISLLFFIYCFGIMLGY